MDIETINTIKGDLSTFVHYPYGFLETLYLL
ncbi:hypothetical protein P872_17475 [Rhodonellum psychrophilum GCM71 = DSM 17998]|uniref:Uncharacterized protein n=1 Tax=Rhodonellum psychrophilum GCM71 = DSM 17998 TaxID=1123057 RepID=U5BZ53_9BACT|nr:hypothetical protein P872_17475 [Rhodonellum psychrophilum GCM71 = DSM 17998]